MEEVMDVSEEIESFNAAFAAALARNDVEQLGQCYTDDAVFLTTGMATVHGRSAIVELFEPAGESSAAIEFDSERTLEGGDLVVDIGNIVRAGDRQARYVVVHRRQTDGSLKLVADIVLPGA